MIYTVTVDDSLVPALDAVAVQLKFTDGAALLQDMAQQRAQWASHALALTVAASQVPVADINTAAAAARAKGPLPH